MTEPSDRRPDLAAITESLRRMGAAMERVGDAARRAAAAQDRLVMADHPDLDALGHELRNIYGGAFEEGS